MSSPKQTPSTADPDAAGDHFYRMPGHLIRRAQQIAVALFAEETSGFDITPIQFALLSELSQSKALDQVTLASHIAVDVATLGQVAARLEERELVAREADPADARRKRIVITRKGRAVLRQIAPAVGNAQTRILAPLNARDQATFARLLEKLVRSNNDSSRAPLRRTR